MIMRKCTYCGQENSEEVAHCQECGTAFSDPSPPPLSLPPLLNQQTLAQEEQRFWERMTFRQFAVLILRLQAVLLIFHAMLEATYLPSGIIRLHHSSSFAAGYSTEVKFELVFAVLRIVVHIAVAGVIIQHARRVLSWLVKDLT